MIDSEIEETYEDIIMSIVDKDAMKVHCTVDCFVNWIL